MIFQCRHITEEDVLQVSSVGSSKVSQQSLAFLHKELHSAALIQDQEGLRLTSICQEKLEKRRRSQEEMLLQKLAQFSIYELGIY